MQYPTEKPKSSARKPWLLFTLTLAVLAAVIYFGGQEYLKARDALKGADERAEKARLDLVTAEASARSLQDRVKGLEEQLDKTREEKSAIANEREQLADEVAEKEAELAKLKQTYGSLRDKLQAEIKKGDILLSEANGRIKVDLVDKVLFDSGQADLSPRGQEVLSRVAQVLKDVDDKTINVSGHTDDSPITDKLVTKYPTNWELSVARAVNVVRYLNEQGKVPAKRLAASGYSQYHPVASNANGIGRAKNRRIEILLSPELEKTYKAPVVKQAAAKEEKKPNVKVAATKNKTAPKKK